MLSIQKSIYKTLMNLKEIILRSNLYRTWDASICVRVPGYASTQDIIVPPFIEVIDNTQHVPSLIKPINLCIKLQIERNHTYYINSTKQLSRWKLSYKFHIHIHASLKCKS